MHGYIGFDAPLPPAKSGYGAGMGFCSAVWPLIDRPSFQQCNWSAEKKAKLQAFVERIHATWPIHRDYIPPPGRGTLVSLDPALLV